MKIHPRLPLTLLHSLVAVAGLIFAAGASAQDLVKEYTFDDVPAYLPDWGAGYKGTYKPAASFKEGFKVTLDKMNPHSGTGCLQVEIEPGTEGEIRVHSPNMPVVPGESGTPVQVRAYVRTEGTEPGTIGLGILEKSEASKTLGYVGGKEKLVPLEEPTKEWQEVTLQGKLNSATRSIILMVTIDPQPSPAFLWIDDISVELLP